MSSSPPDSDCRFGTLAILGVGLIGGSIASAARSRGIVDRVIGLGRNPRRLREACRKGLIDEASTSLEDAAAADLVVVCTPVDRITRDVRDLAAIVGQQALLSDAGSTKQTICDSLADLDGSRGPTFIGAHPLAGSERGGYEHAQADLFVERVCIVTPRPDVSEDVLQRLSSFWESLGARVVRQTPADHDHILARTSHLPHLVAAALVNLLAPTDGDCTASGFRDSTRIAAGDPEIWLPILQANSPSILTALEQVSLGLEKFRRGLEEEDVEALKKMLEEAKTKRDGLG